MSTSTQEPQTATPQTREFQVTMSDSRDAEPGNMVPTGTILVTRHLAQGEDGRSQLSMTFTGNDGTSEIAATTIDAGPSDGIHALAKMRKLLVGVNQENRFKPRADMGSPVWSAIEEACELRREQRPHYKPPSGTTQTSV